MGSASQTTVVLAVWDDYVSERLGHALQSIKAQEPATPIVVVDNASAVPLPPLPGASVVRSPQRLTAGAARNLGLTRVQTPYVVFWDADDIMLPRTLAFLQTAIRDKTAFATAMLEEPGRKRHRWPRRWIARLIDAPTPFALVDSIWSLYPTTGATIMRTQLVRAAGGYADADAGEDWCLGVSLAFRGGLGWSERPGRLYRVHPESLWAQHMSPADLARHARAVRDRIKTDQGIPEWVRRALPLIWLGQQAAIGAHLGLEQTRWLLSQGKVKWSRPGRTD